MVCQTPLEECTIHPTPKAPGTLRTRDGKIVRDRGEAVRYESVSSIYHGEAVLGDLSNMCA